MTNIPKARALLQDALDTTYMGPVAEAKVREALALMTRPPLAARRLTPAKTPRLNARTVARIKELAESDGALSQQEIAVALGTNTGRVSEVLTGKRDQWGHPTQTPMR